jgi:DNA-3-methyladenine glycosylase
MELSAKSALTSIEGEKMADQIEKSESKRLDQNFFERAVEIVAPDLIGCHLFTNIDGLRVGGVIIETEAYDENDMAAHCYTGHGNVPPPSVEPMRFGGGHLYFYYTQFGRCLNITCHAPGFGSAVLIRALRPICGQEIMRSRRREIYDSKDLQDPKKYSSKLCNGPQNICESLGIQDRLHKESLRELSILDPRFDALKCREQSASHDRIVSTPRIGIAKQLNGKYAKFRDDPEFKLAIERPWRWTIQ